MIDAPLNMIAIPILFLFSLPAFAPLSIPGLVVLFLLRKYVHLKYASKLSLLSLTVIAFMSPILLEGHVPIFLPLPFGLWAAFHFNNKNILGKTLLSVCVTMVICFVVALFFWKREEARKRIEKIPRHSENGKV